MGVVVLERIFVGSGWFLSLVLEDGGGVGVVRGVVVGFEGEVVVVELRLGVVV